jgi:phosphoribosylanthranilate isomerase
MKTGFRGDCVKNHLDEWRTKAREVCAELLGSIMRDSAYGPGMTPLERFLDPGQVSLKVCGVTIPTEAERLVTRGVDALGVNFWPRSKRFVAPEDADWLRELKGRILRVGVFVNESPAIALGLVRDGLLDVIQLHGDETPEDAIPYQEAGVPFFKAIGVKTAVDLERATDFGARAILLDAHAPGIYGGTGETFDWNNAISFKVLHPEIPVILAGGIVPENAALAAGTVRPAALDVASGAELSPGIKDFDKVSALLAALNR